MIQSSPIFLCNQFIICLHDFIPDKVLLDRCVRCFAPVKTWLPFHVLTRQTWHGLSKKYQYLDNLFKWEICWRGFFSLQERKSGWFGKRQSKSITLQRESAFSFYWHLQLTWNTRRESGSSPLRLCVMRLISNFTHCYAGISLGHWHTTIFHVQQFIQSHGCKGEWPAAPIGKKLEKVETFQWRTTLAHVLDQWFIRRGFIQVMWLTFVLEVIDESVVTQDEWYHPNPWWRTHDANLDYYSPRAWC